MFNSLVLGIAMATASAPDADASAACAVPDAPASVAFYALPETPFAAKSQRLTGMTSVEVNLDTKGAIVGAAVAKSSGTPMLDREALATTYRSRFLPEVKSCTARGGSYIYEVVFNDD